MVKPITPPRRIAVDVEPEMTGTFRQCGWLQFHPSEAPKGDLETQSLTEGDKLAGWVQEPIYRKVG